MKIVFILLMLVSLQSRAQDLKHSAHKNFTDQLWEAATEDYIKYLKSNDGDSSDWYNLAYSEMQLKKYDQAIEHFNEAKRLNYDPSFIAYNTSKIYALKNDPENMYRSLYEGAQHGLAAYVRLKSDSAFLQYGDSPEFKSVMDRIELNAYPCLSNDNYRNFDFWVGEWEVHARGGKVGENSITMATGGCAIHENYITPGNYAGQSINFYDPIDKKWHQHWVGSSGDVFNYLETKRGEGMLQFESKFADPQGNMSLSRLTFTRNEDGTVRQLFENSYDEGKTWTASFDGLYKRKATTD